MFWQLGYDYLVEKYRLVRLPASHNYKYRVESRTDVTVLGKVTIGFASTKFGARWLAWKHWSKTQDRPQAEVEVNW